MPGKPTNPNEYWPWILWCYPFFPRLRSADMCESDFMVICMRRLGRIIVTTSYSDVYFRSFGYYWIQWRRRRHVLRTVSNLFKWRVDVNVVMDPFFPRLKSADVQKTELTISMHAVFMGTFWWTFCLNFIPDFHRSSRLITAGGGSFRCVLCSFSLFFSLLCTHLYKNKVITNSSHSSISFFLLRANCLDGD